MDFQTWDSPNVSKIVFLLFLLAIYFYDFIKYFLNFQKRLGRLRKKAGLPETVVFHSLRNTFATRMENLGVPKNHISQLMGHEDGNMALDVYSGGLAIEPLRESIVKLSYGDEIDNHLNKGIIR